MSEYLTPQDRAAIQAIEEAAMRRYHEDQLLAKRNEHDRMIQMTDAIRAKREAERD
jgi:hypothetical protein